MTNRVDLDGNHLTGRQLILRGVAALLVVGVVTVVLLGKWAGRFDGHVTVVADLHSIGDGLPAGADVKFRGVVVGAVEFVNPGLGGRPNEVAIRLNSHYAESIPADVTARVVPSNIFAVSAVQLVDDATAVRAMPIRDGGRIAEDMALPTVLFQTTITKLREILNAAGRGRNDHSIGVLAAVAAATNGRRGELLTSAAQLSRLIDELNGIVATGEEPSTVSKLIEATKGLSHTAPDLVDALHEAVGPMQTLAEQRLQLQDLLSAGNYTAGTTVEALRNQTDRLVQITTDLTPVLGVFAQNSHHFVPISQRISRFSDAFFAEVWKSELSTAHGRVNVSFTPSYTYTRADCPRYGELLGPSCFTAPEVPARADLPEVLLPQNYQPPAGLAPPPGTIIGDDGNLIAVGPPLVNPYPDLRDPNPPLPPGVSPAPPVPGTAVPPPVGPPPADAAPPEAATSAAPASFGGNVGPIGSAPDRDQLARIVGQPVTAATQLILGPIARGTVVTRTALPDTADNP